MKLSADIGYFFFGIAAAALVLLSTGNAVFAMLIFMLGLGISGFIYLKNILYDLRELLTKIRDRIE